MPTEYRQKFIPNYYHVPPDAQWSLLDSPPPIRQSGSEVGDRQCNLQSECSAKVKFSQSAVTVWCSVKVQLQCDVQSKCSYSVMFSQSTVTVWCSVKVKLQCDVQSKCSGRLVFRGHRRQGFTIISLSPLGPGPPGPCPNTLLWDIARWNHGNWPYFFVSTHSYPTMIAIIWRSFSPSSSA